MHLSGSSNYFHGLISQMAIDQVVGSCGGNTPRTPTFRTTTTVATSGKVVEQRFFNALEDDQLDTLVGINSERMLAEEDRTVPKPRGC